MANTTKMEISGAAIGLVGLISSLIGFQMKKNNDEGIQDDSTAMKANGLFFGGLAAIGIGCIMVVKSEIKTTRPTD